MQGESNIDMSKVEYRLGVSYQALLDALNVTINSLYKITQALKERVLELELEVRSK